MARNLFGGSAADVAEQTNGSRVPGAVGTVWDGPGSGATQLTDLLTYDNAATQTLVADSEGMVKHFYGPDDVTLLYADFGAGRVAMVPVNTSKDLATHINANDPHGTKSAALEEINAQRGAPSGFATLDSRGKVPSSQLCVYPGGVSVPRGWGEFWKAKRNGATSGGKAKVMCVGDSITYGYYVSDLVNKSWVGLVRSALQTAYGDGGSGMYSANRSAPIVGSSKAAAIAAWQANGSIITTTGTWTNTGVFHGPAISSLYATAAATATFKVRGSTVKIFTLAGINTPNAGYTYQIDGGEIVAVADPGLAAASIETTTITGLSTGSHTVVISYNGTSGQRLQIVGVSGENASGIVVDNMGRSGARTEHFIYPGTNNTVWNGGASNPADLVIYALGVNDAAADVTLDTWAANVSNTLDIIKAANNGQTDILILMHHRGNFDVAPFYAQYSARARGIAETYGAALVDINPMGRNSYSYWSSLGYWGDVANVGSGGTDTVHLSDAGSQFVANVLTPILMD